MISIRPTTHLNALTKDYPDLSKQVDNFRANKANGVLTWPNWCFLPMGGWHAIAGSRYPGGIVPADKGHEIARLAAIGAWRYSQGIYQIDTDLLAALAETGIKGDLPADVFLRLPEWCIYVETPTMPWNTDIIYGFWAHLEYDYNDGRHELRMLMDCEAGMQTVIVHLGPWTIAEGISRAMDMAQKEYPYHIDTEKLGIAIERASKAIEPFISILLYLCSDAPEIDDRKPGQSPSYAHATKTKNGWRFFPPPKPKYIQVGQSLGAQLRQAANSTGEPGTEKRPHLRRGHWHGYWTGPLKGDRKFIYHWISPLIVGGGA